jgi:hypothetical protein
LGTRNPNRAPGYRFHSINNNGTSIVKAAEVYAGGNIMFLYVSPSNETISPTDDWFNASEEMQYPASILVADVGESIA